LKKIGAPPVEHESSTISAISAISAISSDNREREAKRGSSIKEKKESFIQKRESSEKKNQREDEVRKTKSTSNSSEIAIAEISIKGFLKLYLQFNSKSQRINNIIK